MSSEARHAIVQFSSVRRRTEAVCQPLIVEDYGVQSMPDVSPPKWHLAHTTWFFEEFLLPQLVENYLPVQESFRFLFNSYYDAVGERVARERRGLLSRPSVEEVYAYRRAVTERVQEALAAASPLATQRALPVLRLGVHHEQQHQELLLTDIKHIFWSNPLRPAYQGAEPELPPAELAPGWIEVPGGLTQVGHEGGDFAFDNEGPRHAVHLAGFRIRSELVSCGEYLEFIDAGGYRRPELWLSDGWAAVREHGWAAPLYWERCGNEWWQMTLAGMKPVDFRAPVLHVSYYEADAYARWRGFRLPTEEEWEAAAARTPALLRGAAWQWTRSAYAPYPGFRALEGALGEYNGKFMCNQMVLRGGSLATPAGHLRPTYRNFFPPLARWQFSGIRLAS
jgi:ergothioneine biosynthesis protein EgtB